MISRKNFDTLLHRGLSLAQTIFMGREDLICIKPTISKWGPLFISLKWGTIFHPNFFRPLWEGNMKTWIEWHPDREIHGLFVSIGGLFHWTKVGFFLPSPAPPLRVMNEPLILERETEKKSVLETIASWWSLHASLLLFSSFPKIFILNRGIEKLLRCLSKQIQFFREILFHSSFREENWVTRIFRQKNLVKTYSHSAYTTA